MPSMTGGKEPRLMETFGVNHVPNTFDTESSQRAPRVRLDIYTSYVSENFASETTATETAKVDDDKLADLVWSSIGSDKIQLLVNRDQQKSFPIITLLREYILWHCTKIVESKWSSEFPPFAFKMLLADIQIKIDITISLDMTTV